MPSSGARPPAARRRLTDCESESPKSPLAPKPSFELAGSGARRGRPISNARWSGAERRCRDPRGGEGRAGRFSRSHTPRSHFLQQRRLTPREACTRFARLNNERDRKMRESMEFAPLSFVHVAQRRVADHLSDASAQVRRSPLAQRRPSGIPHADVSGRKCGGHPPPGLRSAAEAFAQNRTRQAIEAAPTSSNQPGDCP